MLRLAFLDPEAPKENQSDYIFTKCSDTLFIMDFLWHFWFLQVWHENTVYLDYSFGPPEASASPFPSPAVQ